MIDPTEKEEWIGRVRAAMAAKDISIRGLARLMAEQGGDTSQRMVETCRRKLSKWLSAQEQTLPNQTAQQQLGELLGADLRISRRSNWEILEDRLGRVEDAMNALIEGQQDALLRQESMATSLASIVKKLDVLPLTKPRQRRRTGS